MADTLVTKLKAVVNNDDLPLFGQIRLKKKIALTEFRLWGLTSTNTPIELYSPDGTIYLDGEEPAQTITVNVKNTIGKKVNWGENTQYVIIKNAKDIGGIEKAWVVNELELGNAPLYILRASGDFHVSKIPSTVKQMSIADIGTDKGTLVGDLSEFRGTNITQFISHANNTGLTGNLSDILGKYDPTALRGIGIEGSLVEGNLMEMKDLVANSTYDSGSISTSSISLDFRNSKIAGSLDDFMTYLTGKVFSKRIYAAFGRSNITYQGEPAVTGSLTFDENGTPTFTAG